MTAQRPRAEAYGLTLQQIFDLQKEIVRYRRDPAHLESLKLPVST